MVSLRDATTEVETRLGRKPGLLKKPKKVEVDLSDEYKLLKFEFINCGIVTLKE